MILLHDLINYYIQQHSTKSIFTYYFILTNFLIHQILFIYCILTSYIILMKSIPVTIPNYYQTAI